MGPYRHLKATGTWLAGRRRPLVLGAMAAAALVPLMLAAASFAPGLLRPTSLREPPPPPPSPAAEVSSVQLPPPRQVSVRAGSNVYTLLTGAGLDPAEALRLIQDSARVADLTRCRPGETFTLYPAADGAVVSIDYRRGPLEAFKAVRQENRWRVERLQIPCQIRVERVSGTITSSLFQTLDRLGEEDSLALSLIDILSWDVDFAHESHPGDSFSMLVEKYFVEGRRAAYGQVLAAEYLGKVRSLSCFSLPVEAGRMEYYTPAGQSVRKAFLRSPLRYSRITSGYTSRRLHPVTRVVQPHYAVDYAAPRGTPVWAVADGVVALIRQDQASGRRVVLRHPGGYESHYLHLSRYARGLAGGQRVRQKQVIGYVGTSGLATGPHLDYRLRRNSSFVNPLRENFPPCEPVPPGRLAEFNARVADLRPILEGGNGEAMASLEAKPAGRLR